MVQFLYEEKHIPHDTQNATKGTHTCGGEGGVLKRGQNWQYQRRQFQHHSTRKVERQQKKVREDEPRKKSFRSEVDASGAGRKGL